MDARDTVGRLLIVTFLVAGCAEGATSPPIVTAATTATTIAATASPAPTPSVVETIDVAYESANPRLVPGELDVYAPARAGPWPVVVMLPAMARESLIVHARRVADLGFVVFVPSWGNEPAGVARGPDYDGFLAANSEGACAVEFARAHAAEYGGDPGTMIVFGHSAGAHVAAMVAFARPTPSADCLAGTTPGAIDALVTWEGSWIVSVSHPEVLDAIAADPRVLDALTPWKHLAEHKDLKVVMLVSEQPGAIFEREAGDQWAADSWLAVRDPSGDLRRQLEADGGVRRRHARPHRGAAAPVLGPQGAGEPRLAGRDAGVLTRLPGQEGLAGVPGGLREGGDEVGRESPCPQPPRRGRRPRRFPGAQADSDPDRTGGRGSGATAAQGGNGRGVR